MIDYLRYADVAGIQQKDMVRAIKAEFPDFDKPQMSFACNPAKYALCLIPEAEKLLEEDRLGKGRDLGLHQIEHIHRGTPVTHGCCMGKV